MMCIAKARFRHLVVGWSLNCSLFLQPGLENTICYSVATLNYLILSCSIFICCLSEDPDTGDTSRSLWMGLKEIFFCIDTAGLSQYASVNVCCVNTYSPTNVLFRLWAFKFICPLPWKVCGRSLGTQHSSVSLVCEIKCCMWNKKQCSWALGKGFLFFLLFCSFGGRFFNQLCGHLWHLKNYVLYSAMKPLFAAKALCLFFNSYMRLHWYVSN